MREKNILFNYVVHLCYFLRFSGLNTCECTTDPCNGTDVCFDIPGGLRCLPKPEVGEYGHTFTMMFMENTNDDDSLDLDLEVTKTNKTRD